MQTPERIPEFDLYAELEVAPTATDATIDAAWRSLVKRHHPDAAPTTGDTAVDPRIRRLNIAHDWLTDPVRRARYDEARRAAFTTPPSSASQRPASEGQAAGDEPDWAEIRRQVHRSAAPKARPRPFFASPILAVAFGLLVIVLLVGGIFLLTRLPGDDGGVTVRPTVSPRPAATEPQATATATAPGTPSPDGAEALSDTIPDEVGGIRLRGDTGTGADLFDGDDASLNEFVGRAGGDPDELIAGYKAGQATDGDLLTIVALALESVSGAQLAEAFRATIDANPERDLRWETRTVAGRTVAVSQDESQPEVAAYLVSSADAMYLVVTQDEGLAEAAIATLP